MLDQLTNLISQAAGPALQSHPDLDDNQRQQAPQAIASSIMEAIQSHVAQPGGMAGLTQMLSGGGAASSGMAGALSNTVASSVAAKLGISPQIASTVVAAALPMIMSYLSRSAGSEGQGGGMLGNLMGMIGGGSGQSPESNQGQGLGGILGKVFGK